MWPYAYRYLLPREVRDLIEHKLVCRCGESFFVNTSLHPFVQVRCYFCNYPIWGEAMRYAPMERFSGSSLFEPSFVNTPADWSAYRRRARIPDDDGK